MVKTELIKPLILNYLINLNYSTELIELFKKESNLIEEIKLKQDLREIIDDYELEQLKLLSINSNNKNNNNNILEPLKDELLNLTLTEILPKKISKTIKESTNFLSMTYGSLPSRHWNSSEGRFKSELTPCLFTTSVDKTVKIRSASSPYDLLDTYSFTSPVLTTCTNPISPRYLLAGTMAGTLTLYDLVTRTKLQTLTDHNKYIVKVVWSPNGKFVATIGYDRGIIIYTVKITRSTEEESTILLEGEVPDELAESPKVELIQSWSHYGKSNPEGVVFLPNSDYLVYAARDDNLLRYVQLPSSTVTESTSQEETKLQEDWKITSYNLNPNGDAWVSFSILYITLHPTLPILSLQTSTENSRLLLYPFHSNQRITTLFTTIDQGDFTSPRHNWFPKGTGVILTSEDGIIKCLDINGRVVFSLGAHGSASPLEEGEDDLVVGTVNERLRNRRETEKGSSVIKEVVVWNDQASGKLRFASCGFDRTIRIFEA